ncbi:MAG: tetratricopeptide repeat protein [Acidobacteria bacterium]|nr:tetratricopeptide repeat protein [Acidobacteriota bacterium]
MQTPRLFFALFLLLCVPSFHVMQGQNSASSKPLHLVTTFGPGAIALPHGEEWKPELITVYDKGMRPVAQFLHTKSEISVSYILFENRSGEPNPEGCRKDVISPLIEGHGKNLKKRADAIQTLTDGTHLATSTLVVDISAAAALLGLTERDAGVETSIFAFAGDQHTCAELHASFVGDQPGGLKAMTEIVSEFHPVLDYKPGAIDYFRIAQILFKSSPALAVPYFRSSLAAMPTDASYLTPRRIATDQLVMALGMSGDLKNSRAEAEKAIAADPDYPINYYNLACADAEKGDATSARTHLQQAFDRRRNVIQGESMPDPAKDDSLLKLKNNKEFWTFVTSLPRS